jgi:hypothetical protein
VVSAIEPLRPYSRFSRPEPLLCLSSSSSVVLTRLSGPVPNPLLLRKSGSAGNRTRTSGSVAKNPDHQTTEAVSRTALIVDKIFNHIILNC